MLLLLTAALADIPPAPGYVEACTIDKVARGRECKSCKAFHSGREPCETLEKEGFTKQCKTRGASVWSEVHCKGTAVVPEVSPEVPTSPASTAPAPTPEPSRCDTGASGLLWLAAMLPLATRRR